MSDRHISSNLESLLMAARSALRQSICPGCNRSGYRNERDCDTCRERTALCEQLLSFPPTPRPHAADCASLRDDGVLACDCGAAAHNDAIAETLTPDETESPRMQEARALIDMMSSAHFSPLIIARVQNWLDGSPVKTKGESA
jgi:hypothetical protein